MDKVLKPGLRAQSTRDLMCSVRKKDLENTPGPISQLTKVNGSTTKLTAMAFIYGRMVANTTGLGQITTCRDMEFTFILME